MSYPEEYRPEVIPETDPYIWWLRNINIGIIIGFFLGFTVNFSKIPDALFYDFGQGEVMFEKYRLLLLPVATLPIYYFSSWLAHHPWRTAYPIPITADNYLYQYNLMIRFSWIMCFILNLFILLFYKEILSSASLDRWFSLVVIIMIIVTARYFYRSIKG